MLRHSRIPGATLLPLLFTQPSLSAQGTGGAGADSMDPTTIWQDFVDWLASPQGGIKWGLNILLFVVILVAFSILSRVLARIVQKALGASKLKTSDLLRNFFVNTVRKVTFFVGLLIALGQIGVDIGPLLAGLGVVGFVVGFALQGTLSNFASGIMILLYRPYDIGDVVEAAGVTGKVEAMSLVSTTLTTFDNQVVVIPNNSIWGGVIRNATGNPVRRVDMTFGIGYEDDVAAAKKIIEEILAGHELVLKEPAPVVELHELGDSSLNFIARPWTKTGDYWRVYWDVTSAVKERFDAAGISIPYPQRDVHLHGLEALKSS